MDQIESKEVKRNKAIRVITLALLVFGLITAPASAGYTFTGGENYFHLNKFSVKMSNIESQEDYCQAYSESKKNNDIFRS
ncbi:hypothetical protein [Methanosarcina sp.]|uniref:hypothetical protein n=1 Tax=Methanosarcina sp. TaxID=2213 RepID=UPI0029896439|nr:hypothetical protein [Methanosarcina sp.]MDW5549481.1 hypothetical protein [Methanosarcina sp.]MDW5553515.1 hypothetical protein [Methanosarcina sp.]MDW5558680.1 hypothetical protein [Methanosarcina sp.]